MHPPTKKNRTRCFFDLAVDGSLVGRVIMELYNDLCPKTVENFRALCTGECGRSSVSKMPLHYKGCTVHRIVKNFMIQGGDFTAGNGTGGESIFGNMFDDEDLSGKHDRPMLLSMANRGPGTNGSQFFITTRPAPHLDGRHVVFGHVISGEDAVRAIESQSVDPKTHRPFADVIILNCGELLKKSKKKTARSSSQSASEAESDAAQSTNEQENEQVKIVDEIKPSHEVVPEIPTNNYLMRRSKTPEEIRKKRELENGENQNKKGDRERSQRHRDERAREETSRRRGRDGHDRLPVKRAVTKSGHKVRGRGAMRYRTPTPDDDEARKQRHGHRSSRRQSVSPIRRSVTPPHWRQAQRNTITYSELLRRIDKQEDQIDEKRPSGARSRSRSPRVTGRDRKDRSRERRRSRDRHTHRNKDKTQKEKGDGDRERPKRQFKEHVKNDDDKDEKKEID